MSNFYTEQDIPLKKVRTINHNRDVLITTSFLPELKLPRLSPLNLVTKLLLGELEKPILAHRGTSKRIKECQVAFRRQRFVEKEYLKKLGNHSNHSTKI